MTFDSLEENQFVLHKGDGSDQIFAESHHGLYFIELNDTGFIFNMNAGIVNNNHKFSS